MSALNQWLNHLAIMRRARKMGSFFPQWLSSHSHSAPDGTTEAPTVGNPIKRLRQEVGWFRISEHHIRLPKLTQAVRIIHISDVHLREADAWLTQLNRSFLGLEADIVVLTGDIITRGWTDEALDLFCTAIPKGKLCTLAIMGNWEYWAGETYQSWHKRLAAYDIELLCESSVQTPLLQITGTDDHLAGTSHPEVWLPNLPTHLPNLILTHSPAHFARLIHPSVDLVLAGHAHGGQIRLPRLGALWTPRGTGQYIAGWYKHAETHMFVSRGLGWSVAPLRFHCPPEIAVIHCRPLSA